LSTREAMGVLLNITLGAFSLILLHHLPTRRMARRRIDLARLRRTAQQHPLKI
jgi:hypothetical protein